VADRRTRLGAGRRGQILGAALEQFTRLGYDHTRMEAITEAANASIGSVYHHFGGKEQLAAALYVEGLADYQRSLLRALDESAGGAAGTVKELVRSHLRWVSENRDLAAYLLSSDAGVQRATAPEIENLNRGVNEALAGWIDEQASAKRVRKMAPELFYAVVIGPAQEFGRQWLATREKKAMEEAERSLSDAAWRAVKA
jgi:AcrR family transcriptional regulator